MPLLSEVYAALEPLLRAPEIKNLENKFIDTFGYEGIKDARSELKVRILTNQPHTFLECQQPPIMGICSLS